MEKDSNHDNVGEFLLSDHPDRIYVISRLFSKAGMEHISKGHMLADVVAIIGKTLLY